MKTPSDYTFREGTIADLKEIKALNINAYSEFKLELADAEWQKMNTNLNNESTLAELIEKATVFLCTDGSWVVGVVFFVPHNNPTPIYEAGWSYIRLMGVHPEHRGKGIAKQLIVNCIECARKTGEQYLMLHTSEMMPAARHVYENLGFTRYRDIGKIFDKQYWLYCLELKQ